MKERQGNERMGPGIEPVKFLETNNLRDVTRGNSETQPMWSRADLQQGLQQWFRQHAGWIILGSGVCPACQTVALLEASLASTHWMPEATPSRDNQKVPRCCPQLKSLI